MICKYVIEFEIIFQNLFKLLKNIYPFKSYGRSKSGGRTVVIQNNMAKMTEKGPKMGKKEHKIGKNIKKYVKYR